MAGKTYAQALLGGHSVKLVTTTASQGALTAAGAPAERLMTKLTVRCVDADRG